MVATISPGSLADLRRRGEGVTLIDVRTPAEYDEVHVEGARNIPLDRLDPRAIAAEHAGKSGPFYFVCKSGGRSQKACEKMIAAGINDVVSIDGGTAACEAAGINVARSGRKVMSLERQVRICAGGLVVLGAALAAFGLDPTSRAIGLGLAGFIGAGLVFAGVTDTCGMAMMLAKMPWNQVRGAATCCARAVMLAMVLGSAVGVAVAVEHTKDSLEAVQQAVADQKAVLVDVREPEEWNEGHLSGARSLPLSVLEKGVKPDALANLLPKTKIIYVHCLSGGRCLQAADILATLGYDVRPLKPGYQSLVTAGFPAVVGQ
jgi:rhodanese-related sulfurtransferase